jgi:predicted metallopeptidase
MLRYSKADDVKVLVDDLISSLGLFHINKERVFCLRSKGSKTRNVAARIHPFPKVYQSALDMKPFYVIEVISEVFDNLSEVDKEKTMIHELLHIPKSFSGGLVSHTSSFESRVEAYHRFFRSRLP